MAADLVPISEANKEPKGRLMILQLTGYSLVDRHLLRQHYVVVQLKCLIRHAAGEIPE